MHCTDILKFQSIVSKPVPKSCEVHHFASTWVYISIHSIWQTLNQSFLSLLKCISLFIKKRKKKHTRAAEGLAQEPNSLAELGYELKTFRSEIRCLIPELPLPSTCVYKSQLLIFVFYFRNDSVFNSRSMNHWEIFYNVFICDLTI